MVQSCYYGSVYGFLLWFGLWFVSPLWLELWLVATRAKFGAKALWSNHNALEYYFKGTACNATLAYCIRLITRLCNTYMHSLNCWQNHSSMVWDRGIVNASSVSCAMMRMRCWWQRMPFLCHQAHVVNNHPKYRMNTLIESVAVVEFLKRNVWKGRLWDFVAGGHFNFQLQKTPFVDGQSSNILCHPWIPIINHWWFNYWACGDAARRRILQFSSNDGARASKRHILVRPKKLIMCKKWCDKDVPFLSSLVIFQKKKAPEAVQHAHVWLSSCKVMGDTMCTVVRTDFNVLNDFVILQKLDAKWGI